MKKFASILDYSYPFFDPAVWDHDRKLFAYQKDFVLRLITTMYETYNLLQPETWVEDVVILGSLTTSKWLLTSDMDVHIRVNLDAFIASNMPGSAKEQAFEKLDLTRKEFDRAKILAPMTQHPIEFYFESIEFKPSNTALVGVYSILQDIWLKEPITFDADLDFEESKKDVVAQAEALAEELDSSLGKIRRDIQRVDELEAVIQAWGKDKQQLFYSKVEQKLKSIEEEIIKDLKIKQDLVDARHADQNATSEIEIKFKWLARFGFFGILSNLKTLLEQTGGTVTTQELPLIEKIISQGTKKEAGQVIDVNGVRVFKNPSIDLATKIFHNSKDLNVRYVIDPDTNDMYIWDAYNLHHMPAMEALGLEWTQEIYDNFTGTISSDDDIESLFTFWQEGGGEQKSASLKQASDLSYAYWVDPQGKIYTVRPNEYSKDLFTHSDWVVANQELLQDQYGIKLDLNCWKTMKEMYTAGWARIGDSGRSDIGYSICVGNLGSISNGVDNAIAQFYKGGELMVEGELDHRTIVVADPFPNLQQAVNKALSQKRMGAIKKKAEVIEIATTYSRGEFPVLIDPTEDEQQELIKKSEYTELRYLEGSNGNVYVWDAYRSTHAEVARELHYRGFDVDENSIRGTISEDRGPTWPEEEEALGSIKEAFLKEAFEENKECETQISIDFDGTIAKERKFPDIGEPEEGVKEALSKLKEMGYDILIYSCRSRDEEGLELIREYLDKHEIPYDSIFEGDKPFAKFYIDNRAIHFDNWDNVLKTVEKSEKKASSSILKIEPYGGGVEFPVIINPSHQQVANLLPQCEFGELRVIQGNNTYVWDASKATHEHVLEYLAGQGLEEYSNVQTGYVLDPTDIDEFSWEKKASLAIISRIAMKYWLDPNGKEFEVGNLGHLGWIRSEIFHKPDEEYAGVPQVLSEVVDQKADQMIADGWTRITTESDYDFSMEVADINNLPPYLDNFVAQHYAGGGVDIDDLQGNYQDLSDPFPSLQKAIYQAKRLRNAASLFSKKAIGSPSAWIMDPNGKLYPAINNDHQETIDALAKKGIKFSFANGWSTVRQIGNNVAFAVGKLNSIPNAVQNYLDEHNFNNVEIIPEDANLEGLSQPPTVKHKDITFGRLQKEVNRNIMMQRRMMDDKTSEGQTSIDKKAGYAHAYWLDPNGKIYPVRGEDEDAARRDLDRSDQNTHSGWILRHLNLLEREYGIDPKSISGTTRSLVELGWTRIGDAYGTDWGIDVSNTDNIPSFVDDAIAQFAPEGAMITVAGPGSSRFQHSQSGYTFEWPVRSIQQTVQQLKNRQSRSPSPELQQAAKLFSKHDIIAKTKKVKQGDYSCLMALVPHDLAQEIVEWGVRNVPDEDLYLDEDGKLGRELESHITIKYGLLTNNAKHVRRSFNDDKPFHAKLGKVRHFQPPELPFDVLTVEVISEDLQKANKKVCDSFECAEGLVSDEYKPHITIAYVKRDKAHEYVGFEGFDGKKVELDTVIFSPHKGNRTYFSISNDKESSFILEQINKIAGRDIGYWVDPNGEVYDVHASGLIHNEWVVANLEMLHDKYGLRIPIELYNERLEYYKNIEIDDDSVDMPAADEVWTQMIQSGWVRIGDADEGIGVEINDLQRIPPFVDSVLDPFIYDGDFIRVEDINHKYVEVEYPFKDLQSAVNKALSGQPKTASGNNFLPSLFNDTNNEWQFEHGGDDQEIDVNPDPISDETTWYAPCTEGKPRTKEVWRQFLSMFQNPFSKKEEMTISSAQEDLVNIGNITFKGKKNHTVKIEVPQDLLDQYFAIAIDMKKVLKDPKLSNSSYWDKIDRTRANLHDQLVEFAFNNLFEDKNWKDFPAISGDIRYEISDFIESMIPRDDLPKEATYDPELEQKEKDALGEDETLLEYSKGFYDPKKHDFPHNTTWDSLTQDGEPSKPTSVTYSPQISNGDNLDQNSPGGFPRRFMGKPKGEWFSDEGEVVPALQNMWKYKTAALEKGGYFISPEGEVFELDGKEGHFDFVRQMYDTNDLQPERQMQEMLSNGWARIREGDYEVAVEVADITHIPPHVEEFLQSYPESTVIYIDSNQISGQSVTLDMGDLNIGLQKAINKALSQERMGFSKKELSKIAITRQYALYVGGRLAIRTLTRQKALKICQERFPEDFARGNYQIKEEAYTVSKQAGQVIDVHGIRVYKNPTLAQAQNLLKKSKLQEMRGFMYCPTNDLFIWDAFSLIHYQVKQALGIDDKGGFDTMDFTHIADGHDLENIFYRQNQNRTKKQAGDQSASVPDYLINEWKTEQINNDTDEEPYVNHDQRDYPYGMHDSPENTGYNIGWPKDNQPYVVRLDILENPAYRLDPFGIGEYNVTYFSGMPNDDGLEQMNPE